MRTLIFFILTITCACNDDPVQDACNRLDECNALSGSVQECTEDVNAQLDQAAPSQQDEFRRDLQDCLSHATCDAFITCINNLAQ